MEVKSVPLFSRLFATASPSRMANGARAILASKGVLRAVALLVLPCFLFLPSPLLAQYQFKNFSTSEGLSHKTVCCFLQDKQGFIWIGTTYGLNRFDGYGFKTFFHDPCDSLSIGDDVVFDMQEDSKGLIWLSTNAGFYCYNPLHESFQKVRFPGKARNYKARNICIDGDGGVWGLVDDNSLMKISHGQRITGTCRDIDSLVGNPMPNRYWKVKYFDGYMWICGSNGLVRFDYRQNEMSRICPGNIKFSYLRDVKRGVDNTILLVDGDYGIYSLNTQNLQFRLRPQRDFKGGMFELVNITDVESNCGGNMFVTATPGLFNISPTGAVTRINAATGAPFNFDRITSNVIFKDKSGNFWIGTMNDGVYLMSVQKSEFSHFSVNMKNFDDLPALSLFVNSDNVFISNLYGTFKRSIDKYTPSPRIASISDISTFSIAKAAGSELVLFSRDKATFYNITSNKLGSTLAVKGVFKGFVDSRGIIWASFWGAGIEGFDTRSATRYQIVIDTVNQDHNTVYTMFEDKDDGSLWLGTFGAGLVHVNDPLSRKPTVAIYSHEQHGNSSGCDVILSMHDDGNGSIWIGTNGGGLNRFDKKTGKFSVFTTRNGLKCNVIDAVNSDMDGNIWIASSVLSKYDVRSGSFSHFDASDGVASKYFTGAVARGQDGTMYFGDDRGVLTFNPRDVPGKTVSKMPIFTGARLFGQSVNTGQTCGNVIPFPVSVSCTEKITLPHFLNTFTLEFASLDVRDSKNIRYSYALDGVDNAWIPAAYNERSATYSGLRPGLYTFKVRSSNGSGTWSKPRRLIIEITPPWWGTLWFQIPCFFLAIFLVTLLIYFRIKLLKAKNQGLESMVKERTTDLESANSALTEQSAKLSDQAQSLERQNKSLMEKQLVIEMKNQQLEESLDTKDKLLGIIAHDFLTPLTSIEDLARTLKNNPAENNTRKSSGIVDGLLFASTKLKEQMGSVLEWAQGQAHELTCKPLEISIETIIDDAIMLVKESSAQKDIRISTHFDFVTNAFVDPRMMSIVMRNLLVNAIKFTPRGGSVTVVVQEDDSVIEVNIIDTGIGMNPELAGMIFDKNAASSWVGTENEKGTCLDICKAFVEKNRGTIQVKSEVGEGTVFTIAIPKGNEIAARKTEEAVEQNPLDSQPDDDTVMVVDRSQTILVIDDDATIITLLTLVLNPYYTILTAKDGKSGLQLARNMVPNLIVCDMNLPHMSGVELCTLLKEDDMTNHIPIILITSSRDGALLRAGYASGADDFIEKPIDNESFRYKVKSLIDNRKKLSERLQDPGEPNVFIMPESYDDAVMKRVLEFINQNFCDSEFEINVVAENVGLSRTQLWRKFKSTTGINPSDYILNLRMQKAVEMLESGKFKIAEVAYEVGYNSPAYFARCFSTKFGEAPKDFLDKRRF